MLNIAKTRDGDHLTIEIGGRLDTTTSPELESAIHEDIETVTDLRIDMTGLEYISSAGLRVILATQKAINKNNGTMVIANPADVVRDVFEITGFMDILTIE